MVGGGISVACSGCDRIYALGVIVGSSEITATCGTSRVGNVGYIWLEGSDIGHRFGGVHGHGGGCRCGSFHWRGDLGEVYPPGFFPWHKYSDIFHLVSLAYSTTDESDNKCVDFPPPVNWGPQIDEDYSFKQLQLSIILPPPHTDANHCGLRE